MIILESRPLGSGIAIGLTDSVRVTVLNAMEIGLCHQFFYLFICEFITHYGSVVAIDGRVYKYTLLL
jgi:hypothetical protein